MYLVSPYLIALQVMKGFKADGAHFHLIRMMGVYGFSGALLQFMSLGYQNENDTRQHLLGSIVVSVVLGGLFQQMYVFLCISDLWFQLTSQPSVLLPALVVDIEKI